MSFQSIKKFPSTVPAQCPDCGVTISHKSGMNRHRRFKHSDGTEAKFPCPWPGCPYKSVQKVNLKTHIDAMHSNKCQYPCPECDDSFGNSGARIRHRKRFHGYKPYHTEDYYARQALKKKEDVVQGAGKTVSSTGHRQRAASAAPYSLPNAPSGNGYHDDAWKALVDMACSRADISQSPLDVQIHLPSATGPGRDVNQAMTDISLQPISTFQPSLPTSGMAITQDSPVFSAVPSESMPPSFLYPSGIGIAGSSSTPGGSLTNSESGFMNNPRYCSMPSYGNASPSTPDAMMTVPTIPASSQSDLLPFVLIRYKPATQLDYSAPGQTTDFSAWCQSNTTF